MHRFFALIDKNFFTRLAFCVLSLAIIFGVYIYINNGIVKENIRKDIEKGTKNKATLIYGIDEVNKTAAYVNLQGYTFTIGKTPVNAYIVFRDDTDVVFSKIRFTSRPDVIERYYGSLKDENGDSIYSKVGMKTRISQKELKDNRRYNISFLTIYTKGGSGTITETSLYYENGMVKDSFEDVTTYPDIDPTGIIREDNCMGYDGKGLWAYRQENEFAMVADNSFIDDSGEKIRLLADFYSINAEKGYERNQMTVPKNQNSEGYTIFEFSFEHPEDVYMFKYRIYGNTRKDIENIILHKWSHWIGKTQVVPKKPCKLLWLSAILSS